MRKHVIFILTVFFLFSCEYRDEVPPAVNIAYPGDLALVSGRVEILVAATDNDDIRDVTVLADNEALILTKPGPYLSTLWQTDTFDDGWMHTLTAIAADLSGNTNISPLIRVLVKNIPVDPSKIWVKRNSEESYLISWIPSPSSSIYNIFFINPRNEQDTLYQISEVTDTAISFIPGEMSDAIVEIHPHTDTVFQEPLYRRYSSFKSCFLFRDLRDDELRSAYIRSSDSPFIRRLTADRNIREMAYSAENDKVYVLHEQGIDVMDGDGSNRRRLRNGFFYNMELNRDNGKILALTGINALIINPNGSANIIPVKGMVFDARWAPDSNYVLITALPNKLNFLRCYQTNINDAFDVRLLSPNTDEKDYRHPLQMEDAWLINDGQSLYKLPFDSDRHEKIRTFDGSIFQMNESPDGTWFMLVLRKTGLIATDIFYELLHISWPDMNIHSLFTDTNVPSISISPDGKKILYSRNSLICLSSPEGGDERIIETGSSGFTW